MSTSSTFSPIVDQGSVNSPTTQDVISGLANGTYFLRVQAVDSALDQGTWSAPQSLTITGVSAAAPAAPVLAPPQAYTTFHPSEAGTTSWTPVPGAATYIFETSQNDPNFGWSNTSRGGNIDTTTISFNQGFEGTVYARVYAVTAFARDMLTVEDNLSRALDSVPAEARAGAEGALKGLVEGVELTARDLQAALARHGVTKLEPTGGKFDPNFHQAMFEAPNEELPAGTVAQVVQSGWRIGDRVLRPAMVGVSKGGPKVAASAD